MCDKNRYNSLIGVLQHFSDEKVCLEHLESLRWPDGNPICPHCGNEKAYRFKDGKRFKCSKCRKQFTAKVGTIFQGSNIPLNKWFAAIYLATSHKKGISSHQLAKDIDISQKSAWHVLHRIREMVKEKDPTMLNNSVDGEFEIDEHFHGGLEKNKHANKRTENSQGRSTKTKTTILGIIQRGGKVIALPVKDTKAGTLVPIMRANIPAGATVYTDEWYAYRGLSNVYEHEIVKHASGEYVVGNAHTNSIESFWAILTRSVLGIYHQVSKEHLGSYCDEVAFRFNTKKTTESKRFDLAIAQSNGRRLKWKDLTAKRKNVKLG